MVYLQTPRVFHSLTVLSRDAETICRLSAENATLITSFSWPTKRFVVLPLSTNGKQIFNLTTLSTISNTGHIGTGFAGCQLYIYPFVQGESNSPSCCHTSVNKRKPGDRLSSILQRICKQRAYNTLIKCC